jgi:hypothetical protein
MYERVPRYLTKYGDVNRFSRRPTLVRIGSGSGHLVTCPARGTLLMDGFIYVRHAPYMVFLLALCPFFFFAFASFPSISPDGSLPCSSHSSSIFVAAWYPSSCISSNLVHCSVPYCHIRDWQHIPSVSSSTHLLNWHRHIKATTGDLGLFQSLHTRNAVRIM